MHSGLCVNGELPFLLEKPFKNYSAVIAIGSLGQQ